MFQEMCEECGVDNEGMPSRGDWDPNAPAVIETMRTWLSRLRQTCLHPQVGIRNRKALGNTKGPLRTVAEVLAVMTEQNDIATRSEERALQLSKARRGQILEHANRTQDALQIWQETLEEAKIAVNGCRQHLSQELTRTAAKSQNRALSPEAAEAGELDSTRAGVYRQRLRSALEVQHLCTFFIANAYYQIKSNEHNTESGSAAYQELEKAEERNYEIAKRLRQELLSDVQEKADLHMGRVQKMSATGQLVKLVEVTHLKDRGGIESRNILAKIDDLIDAINEQVRKFQGIFLFFWWLQWCQSPETLLCS